MPATATYIIEPDAESGVMTVTGDVHGLRVGIVNVYFLGAPETDRWVLVDAGLHGTAGRIVRAAEHLYGAGARPSAIVLTHGHFDHVGALGALLERWGDVPVYAHEMELPYLTGRSAYPPPDSRATTSAPTSSPSTPVPPAATRPETSRPGYSGAPGGTG